MKKILLSLFVLFLGIVSYGQYPLIQNLASDSTLIRLGPSYNGGIKGGLINMTVTDTSAANLLRIRQYPGSQIYTTNDGYFWIRNKQATGWIQLGGGSLPSGSFWRIGGNGFPVGISPYPTLGTLAPWGGSVGFMTSSVVNLVLPDGGILRSASSFNKCLTFDTVTKLMYYTDCGSGGASVNIYNSDGTLIGNRVLNGSLYNITFDSLSNYLVNAKRLNLQTDATLLGRMLLRNNTMKVDTGEVITRNGDTLSIPTYDGSYQAMHPDVYYNPNGWNGYKYWMAFTPYPNGNDDYENPSIVVSNDNVTWVVPPGVTNPLVPFPGGSGYNADPDILEGQDDSLHIFYINNETDVFVISSANGVAWTTPIKVIDQSVQTILSPSVILDSGFYKMYYVDAAESPNLIKYRTASVPTGPWSSPITCTFSAIPAGQDLWHMNITKTHDEYHVVVTTSASGSFNNNFLHFATSNNGQNFAITGNPILSPSATSAWDDARIYRSALVYVDKGDESYYNLYYTGVNSGGEWHTGLTKLKLSQYVRNISTAPYEINFAGANGVSRATLDSMNKFTVRRGVVSPTGFYPGYESKTDSTYEKIGMGMFETGVGSNPYIIGDYSTAQSNVHNTGWLSRRNGTLDMSMLLSNAGNFGGTAGAVDGGFFAVGNLGTGQFLMGVNKSRELFLGNTAALSRVRLSYVRSSYVLDSFGVNTLTPARVFHSNGTARFTALGTASADTTNNKPLAINSSGDVIPMTYWPGSGGGGGSPGGSDTYGQFNDAGSFGGDAGFTYNKTTDALTIGGNISAGAVYNIGSSQVIKLPGGALSSIYGDAGSVSSIYTTVVGGGAGGSGISGNFTTAVGSSAIGANGSSGVHNTAVGVQSLFANTAGAYGTAVGSGALALNTTSSGSTAIGYGALYSQNGGSNIGIGYQAGDNITSGARNIIIGYDIDAPTASTSDFSSLGNLFFMNGGFGTGTTIGAGNVGIAVAAPGDRLSIDGNLSLVTAGNKIKIATGSNSSAGTATLSSGTVTISTTAVTSSSLIFVVYDTPSGTLASGLSAPVGSIVNATSFVINSLTTAGVVNTLDGSTVRWWLIN